jgi:hypothetical protein
VLDGEIAVPNEKGATHIGDLQDEIAQGQGERLAYFAFNMLHFNGHDLRGCPIQEGKDVLERFLKGVSFLASSVLATSSGRVIGYSRWRAIPDARGSSRNGSAALTGWSIQGALVDAGRGVSRGAPP